MSDLKYINIEKILKDADVYSQDLELSLLRNVEIVIGMQHKEITRLQSEIKQIKEEAESACDSWIKTGEFAGDEHKRANKAEARVKELEAVVIELVKLEPTAWRKAKRLAEQAPQTVHEKCQELKRQQIESKTTDEERWRWLRKNSLTCDFVVMLDNDETYIADHSPGAENDWHNQPSFDKCIGDAPGIPEFLGLFCIKAEHV